jgi:hypothetical protein
MSRIICLFSDGTGQAGGQNSVNWTNVYRLFVNTRDIPGQLCFYDPGLGAPPDPGEAQGLGLFDAPWRAIQQAVGAGITENIVDLYTALLLAYEPGDRVFLFGFSRGAYTVRSAAGAMALCGVPPGLPKVTRWQDFRAHLHDPAVRAIAEEAVRKVYQTYQDSDLRARRGAVFRQQYGSAPRCRPSSSASGTRCARWVGR